MKIAIIGNAGSGKSTFATNLHKKLQIPLYHLDQYYWKPDWQRIAGEEFEKIHHKLCDQNNWIIDGVGKKVMNYRFEKADIIIFLDISPLKCLWRVIKRALFNWGKVIPGSPEGCKQEIFSYKFLEFLNWIWNFDEKYKNDILQKISKLKDTKKVYIVSSQKDQQLLIQELEKIINI